MISVDLLVPGITPPPAILAGAYPVPRLAALERLLAYAKRQEAPFPSFEAAIFDRLGYPIDAGCGLPVAAATHRVDFDDGHEGVWMRADPVVLRPDLGQLLLQNDQIDALTRDEARALIAELNAGMADSGIVLELGRDSRRWYLRLPAVPSMVTQSPLAALGRHVDPLVPRGLDAGFWHRVGNDLQMLLHGSTVNAERQARGLEAVNSLWFWGAGTLEQAANRSPITVWSDDPLAQGLALAAGDSLRTLSPGEPADIRASLAGDTCIILGGGWRESRVDAPQAWEEVLRRLESLWFEPILELLRRRRIDRLRLHTLRHCFELRPSDCRRFWRRPRPLSAPI